MLSVKGGLCSHRFIFHLPLLIFGRRNALLIIEWIDKYILSMSLILYMFRFDA